MILERRTMLVALALALALPACRKSSETLTYEGSSTIGETILPDLISGYERTTGSKFGNVAITGSVQGFKAVMAGRAAIGGMSRPLKAPEKAQSPYYEIIGYDALAIYVQHDNPVRSLTRKQLKGIFTGQTKNWKEVGGADAPIEIVTEHDNGHRGTVEMFKENILESAPFGPAREFELPKECVAYVGTAPNAITHGSAAFNTSTVKEIALDDVLPNDKTVRSGDYALARPILLLSKSAPDGAIKAFFDYVLSRDGQATVAKAFVPRQEVKP